MAGSAAHSTRAKSKNYSFTMMLCINRYENYTRASSNSFQTSYKVLKRYNYQMIRYGVYNVIDSVLSRLSFRSARVCLSVCADFI